MPSCTARRAVLFGLCGCGYDVHHVPEASVIDRLERRADAALLSAFQCIWAIGLLEHWKRKKEFDAQTLGLWKQYQTTRVPVRSDRHSSTGDRPHPAGRRTGTPASRSSWSALTGGSVGEYWYYLYARDADQAFDKTTSSTMAARYASVVAR